MQEVVGLRVIQGGHPTPEQACQIPDEGQQQRQGWRGLVRHREREMGGDRNIQRRLTHTTRGVHVTSGRVDHAPRRRHPAVLDRIIQVVGQMAFDV